MASVTLKESLRRILEDELRAREQVNDQSVILTHAQGILQTPYRRVDDVSKFFRFIADPSGRDVVWEILGNAQDEISSISGMTIRFGRENLIKTRHELVSEFFTGMMHTDTSWSTMCDTIEETTTPDAIFQLGPKEWLVLEVGTCLGRPGGMYRDKFMKYMITLTKLAETHPDWKIFYWIVIVTPQEVLTTFKIQGNAINELVLRFKIGLSMEDEMRQRRLLVTRDGDLTESERAVKGSLQRLSQTPMSGNDQIISDSSVQDARNFTKDTDYIGKATVFMFKEAVGKATTKSASAQAMAESFSKIEQKISEAGNTRTDKKSPVQFPLVEATLSVNEIVLSDYPLMEADGLPKHIDHLWRTAFGSKLERSESFEPYPEEEELHAALGPGIPESDGVSRSKWHRVEIDLGEHAEQLSLDGLQAKRFKDTEFKAIRRQTQSRGFSLLAPTDDIESCLQFKPQASRDSNKYFSMIEPLLDKANALTGNTDEGIQRMHELFNSDIVVALCQLSAIAAELAVSLRQHVTPNGWILKKVLYYDIELLVKPTNSESHVFFTLRMRGTPLEQGTFRRMYFSRGWWYTDVLSVNQSRLDNLIRSPAVYLSTLLHFRINVDRVEREDVHINTVSGYSEKMAMLTLLISLEDKSTTEEMALNVRYLIMQFSKGVDPISPPEPGPVVSKTPTILRSRLAVYLFSQIKKYCFLQMSNLPVKVNRQEEDTDHSSDIFDGLLCPFTHHELKTLYDAVQCMYIAYAKNKDTSPEQNCDFAMIKKIVEYGANTDPEKDDIYRGRIDPPIGEYPGPHEFSPSFLTEACELLSMRFRSDYGANWRQVTTDRILSELVRSTHHESLATLKASADFDAADARVMAQLEEREENNFKGLNQDQIELARQLLNMYRRGAEGSVDKNIWAELSNLIEMGKFKDTQSMGKGRYKRVAKSCKCHEAVIRELKHDDSIKPLLIGDYESIFKCVLAEMGGVCCYLFKKNQHGGLREIYVLTFKSRLLQLLPEVAARVICGMCSEEVLTHPDKKTSGYELHHANVSAASGRGMSNEVVHRTSSEDKSKWSQGMNVAAFSFMFSKLVDPMLASAIARVLHLFRNKKVLLPEGVINLLSNNIRLTDSTYEMLRKAFHDPSDGATFDNIRGNIFLRTPTGMWQGILHYCSSLLHVLQTIHYKNTCRLHFRAVNARRELAGKDPLGTFVIDTVVSSDDSATYGSIVLPQGYSKEVLRVADELLDLLLKLEDPHSRHFMMIESPKSCISSKTVGEFNSIFSCSRTYVSPAIKKVLAAATIPENEDLESRQVVLSNMYKDMLEEGCSHYQIHLMELTNALLHYTAFGLTTSRLFPYWADMIIQHPDPHLGFMLVDLQDCAGGFGYDFKKLLSLEGTSVPLMPTSPALIQLGIEGQFNSGVILTQGDRRRWLQLTKRVTSPGWEEYLESNPHVMYMERGLTKEEITARLSAKACSKGVHEGLKQDSSIARVISGTVYLLSRNVISVKTLDIREEGVSKELSSLVDKSSLMAVTKRQLENDSLINHANMTPEQRSLFYPNHLLHTNAAQALKALRANQLVRTVMYRRVRNKIEVRGSTSVFVVPLLTVLRWKWFSQPIRHALTILNYSWKHYKTIFPWLKDTAQDSLDAGPFTSHVRLFGFVQSVDKKGARLNILCRRIRSFNPFDQMIELATHNWFPGLRRLPSVREAVEHAGVDTALPMVKMSVLSSILSGLIYAPIQADATEFIESLLVEVDLSDQELYTMSKSRKYSRLAVVYAVATSRDPMVISTCLLNSCRGVIKTYVVPQHWNGTSWEGPGRLLLSTGRLTAEVLVHDTHIIAIRTQNINSLQQEYPLVADYLKADGFNWDPPHNIGRYKEYFSELSSPNTDWTATAHGLINMPTEVTHHTSRAGIKTSTKKPVDLLINAFPIILHCIGLLPGHVDGEVMIVKQIERSGRPSIRVVNKVGERRMTLLKYFGPHQPRVSEDSKELFHSLTDTDSIMHCWITGTPISSKVAFELLKSLTDSGEEVELPECTLEGVDKDLLNNFLRESFKWRCIGRSKIQLDLYRFIDDLEDVDFEAPFATRDMKERMNEVVTWFDEVAWGAHSGDPEPEPNVFDIDVDWAEEGPVEHDEPYIHGGTEGPPQPDEEESSSGDTVKIDANAAPFRSAPTMYMSHCFWDILIDRLEKARVWTSIREGLPLTGTMREVQVMICAVLSIRAPEEVTLDLSDDSD